jgi:hypothetical protein
MKSNYVIWAASVEEKACSLAAMDGWADDYQLLEGEHCLSMFPKKAKFKMDPDNRKGIQLRDSLRNMNRLLVVSNGLRELLESLKLAHMEFIPVPIFDHKNKAVAAPYSIVNPLNPVDCLMVEKCNVRWSGIDKTKIDKLRAFVIDESKIEPGRLLFRAKFYNRRVVIHRKLAAQIDSAKFTGIRWVELADYPEK